MTEQLEQNKLNELDIKNETDADTEPNEVKPIPSGDPDPTGETIKLGDITIVSRVFNTWELLNHVNNIFTQKEFAEMKKYLFGKQDESQKITGRSFIG